MSEHQPKRPRAHLRGATLKQLGLGEHRLTAIESKFVSLYVAGPPEIRGRALRCAHAAGLSAKDTGVGTRLMARPRVKAAIEAYYVAAGITAQGVLAEIRRVAFSDMRDFQSWGPNGLTLTASEELTDDAAACVAEVSETVTESSTTMRFKLHDKIAALTTLAKHLGLLRDRVEHTGKDGGPIEVDYVGVRERLAGQLARIGRGD